MQARTCWRRHLLCLVLLPSLGSVARAQMLDTIPSQVYYNAVGQLYSGNFRDAQRTFARNFGSVKTLNQGGAVRWVDSICYYAMLGETFYQWGQPDKALAQFDLACNIYLQYPQWMLRVQFDAQPTIDPTLARAAIPWGAPQRRISPGRFKRGMPVAQGSLNAAQQIQQGGAIMQPQYWTVDVVEINRCLALAIRRRNEILGPLGPHDAISKNIASVLGRGATPPNHWSGAWVDIQRGLALAGLGEREQATQLLQRGLLVSGQLDHPLTCVALLEQGRIALQTGNVAAAANLFAEASYSAYLYQDYNVIDDAFRYIEVVRQMSQAQGVNPMLAPAQVWARRERYDFLAARLSLAIADELLNQGDVKNAAPALAAAGTLLRDARTGYLGNWAMYLEAKLQFNQHRDSAATVLASALAGQSKISLQNFQINLANRMFDAQTLPSRTAGSVYEVLLADPSAADGAARPLETMGLMVTPHDAAFERWLISSLERKNIGAALEITDRAKRRRFHNALPWGGRVMTVRDLLMTPTAALPAARQQAQHDVLAKFPGFAEASANVDRARGELDAAWRPPLDAEGQKKSVRLWEQYAEAVVRREKLVDQIALARVPADYAFPPLRPAAELQQNLASGQAMIVYHDTADGLLGFAITSKGATSWNCGPSRKLSPLISQFLRDCGNVDANRELTTDELAAGAWQKSGEQLYKALFQGASLDPATVNELVIVPDGITWYVPFEALFARTEHEAAPLIKFAKVRYAPTPSLAFSFAGSWRRVARTGIAAGKLVPGDRPPQRLAKIAGLEAAIDGPLLLTNPLPAPSPLVASLLDTLVVLEDIDTSGDPMQLTPLPLDKAQQQGALANWTGLPGIGPQRVLLPGIHTPAERGGKVAARSRRGGGPGDELFFTSCSLIESGAETMLLSRWRVGGQSTLDLMREFLQSLPDSAAADAWQRSVELTMQMPIDPLTELRVKAGKAHTDLTGAHPFFWAGYLVVDTGWRPEPPPEPPGEPVVAAPMKKPSAGAVPAGAAVPAPKGPAPAPAADAALAPLTGEPAMAEQTPTTSTPVASATSVAPAAETTAADEPQMTKSPDAPPPAPTPPTAASEP
jgi:tetratricopeptide (TPR) repeat protein